MDTPTISVLSGLVGSLIGGSATVATAWVTQRTVNRR
jgi:tetrahydromethanopterin S-methyltransferase subunit D